MPDADQSLWDKVAELKEKAAEFTRVFGRLEELKSIAYADPAAKSKWDSLMGAAHAVMKKVRAVTGWIDSVYGSITNLFGVDITDSELEDNTLGLAFIPIAVILGALAAITAWLSNAYVQLKELEAVEALIKQNVAPTDAYKLVRGEQGGILSTVGSLGTAALLIGGVLMYQKGRK